MSRRFAARRGCQPGFIAVSIVGDPAMALALTALIAATVAIATGGRHA